MNTENRSNRIVSTLVTVATVMTVQIRAATLYVSQTSPNPSPPYSTPDTAAHTIQEAVDTSNDGDTVLVEPGDYVLTNQVTVTKAIVLQSSGGVNQTFLTGAQDHTFCLWISNSLAVADGFSMRRQAFFARGAFLVGGTVQNCTFTNLQIGFPPGVEGPVVMRGGTMSNSIVTYGRGPEGVAVFCGDGGFITDCQILGHPGGLNGIGVSLLNSRLENSVISGVPGSGNASGVAVSSISSTVVGCTISNNFNIGKGGGAYLQDSLMDGCIVTGNRVGHSSRGFGGGGVFETNSVIRNSLIFGNRAVVSAPEPQTGGLGGGVYMQGGALLNCTVSKNSAQEFTSFRGAGGGVYAESGDVTNSIIYFNTLDVGSASSNWFNQGSATFDHCCTTPNPGGSGNITQDPQFVDATNGDFHLAFTSPCIDAGITQPWMADASDLDGNPRVRGSSVDIGAYESPTPQELAQSLIDDVNALIAAGTLDHGPGNALLVSLQAALNSINHGNTQAACGQVSAFIDKVQEFVSEGQLNAANGQSLISAANNLRSALRCGGT